MRRRTAPTLQDIADEAGVHVMAASVVLNGARSTARVSAPTRARILEAASRLHYRPNGVAQGLLRGRMNAIGVVAVIDGEELNLYGLEILNGILEQATKRGQSTVVCSVPAWEKGESEIHSFCDGRVDGVVFVAPRLPARFFETLQGRTPLVTIHHEGAGGDIYNLDSDGERGAFAAVAYLAEQGHRKILHMTGEAELYVTRQRLAGYRRALARHGIAFDPNLVVHGSYSSAAARRILRQRMEDGSISPLPSALFGANDAIAIGCMEVFAEFGIRVPDDISIVGFDDTLAARTTTPPLTTVRQPLRMLGRRAVEVLLDRIDAGGTPAPSEMMALGESAPNLELYDATLVVRGSVAPPPVSSSFP